MIYLAYVSLVFLFVQLVNVLINTFFQQKLKHCDTLKVGLVSVLIPARNEERNIVHLLSDLRKIRSCDMEIIVFDDESTDETAKVVQECAKFDSRICFIRSSGLQEGWLGKNYACYQLAENAKGDYLLFLDADVRISGDVIKDAVWYSKKYGLKLLSCFPKQVQYTLGERVSVPVMNYILLTLLPLIFVRVSPFSSHAAANGQFMLYNTQLYKEIQPHFIFKNCAVEDIAIARFLKKRKIRIACFTGEKRIQCRMYSSYQEAINGFSKNIFMYFGNIPLLAFLFWLYSVAGFIPVLAVCPQFIKIYFCGVVSCLLLYSFVSRQNGFFNLVLFPLQLFFLFNVMGFTVLKRKSRTLKWKKRYIN